MPTLHPLTEKTLAHGSFALHYYTAGAPTNPALIFLHPAFGDYQCFLPQVDFFAASHHVILVDMPGHGGSQPRKGSIGIEQTGELLQKLLAAEGHAACHIAGVSLGSLIAQDFAYRFPEKVKTLTVVGGYSIFGDNQAVQRAQGGEIVKWTLMILFSMERFRRYVARVSVLHPHGQEIFYQSARRFPRGSFGLLAGMNKVLRPQEHASPHPLLIISGDHDRPLVRQVGEAWQRKEPLGRYAVIANAGHCANLDNPEAFNRLLADFLNTPAG
jgi:pimeloyl-ACP methyl ester carboxylesterase